MYQEDGLNKNIFVWFQIRPGTERLACNRLMWALCSWRSRKGTCASLHSFWQPLHYRACLKHTNHTPSCSIFLVIKINGFLSKLSLAGSILVRRRLVEKGILIWEIILILTDRKEVHKNTCLDQSLNIIEAPSNYMMSMRTSSAEDAMFSPEGSWRMVLLRQEATFQLRVWIKW